MDANNLLAKHLDFADIEFTYESDDGTHISWLDHVVVSSNVLHRIHKIYILCDGPNLSVHRPLCVKLQWAPSPSLVSSRCSHLFPNRLAWYKATDEQIHAYKSLVTESCCTIEIPNEVLNCIDPNFLIHNSVLEQLCSQMINCLRPHKVNFLFLVRMWVNFL